VNFIKLYLPLLFVVRKGFTAGWYLGGGRTIHERWKGMQVFKSHGTLHKWRHSVVVSALALIKVVNWHCVWLVLGWVTVCGWVNHLGM